MDLTYIAEVGDLSSQTTNILSRESKGFQRWQTASFTLLLCIASPYCLQQEDLRESQNNRIS